jgi:hypothetical protein
VSEDIYTKSYTEQVESNFENVPLLKQSPFGKIYETRAKFLEPNSIFAIDELVDCITNPNSIVPLGFTFFRTDFVTNNPGVVGKLEFSLYFKQRNKFYFELKFGKHTNKISFCIEDDQIYIYNFLNNLNNFGELGLGHTVMSFIKTLALRIQTDIMLTFESQPSLQFYTKEHFELVSPNGDELIWKWNREKLEQGLMQLKLASKNRF